MGFKKVSQGTYYFFPRGKIKPEMIVKQTVSGTSYYGYINVGKLKIARIPKELIGKYVQIELKIIR